MQCSDNESEVSKENQSEVVSNWWDLSRCRKLVIESDDLTIGGRQFHILGSAAQKAWYAVIVLVLTMIRMSVPAERSGRVGM